MNQKPKVLIVGAGAGGMVTGYHFSLSGADVTFYVRPSRMEQIQQKPKKLYCYNDNQVKLFDEYDTVCSMDDVATRQFDYVLTTLDGKAMHSEEGKKLLQDLGNAVRDSNPVLVCLGVAQGIEDFIFEHTGIARDRSLFGSFGLFSHDIPGPTQSHPPEVDQEALESCSFAYVHTTKNNVGLGLTRLNGKLGKQFGELYGRSGVSTCMVAPNLPVMDFMNCFPFPALIAFVIEDWITEEEMYKTSTWKLASKATMEIMALPQYGFLGRLMATIGGPLNMITKMWRSLSKNSFPLDFHAFNQFHHGGKVLAQDIEILHDILAHEEGLGRQMPNLRALLMRLDQAMAA